MESSVPKYDMKTKEVLGFGAFGVVLKVNRKGGDPVAIKLISLPKYAWGEKQQLGYDREIEAMKMHIGHPFIVQYIEDYEENDIAYIVMEYASGGSLKKKLDDLKALEGILNLDKALKFFTMMCLGILTLHKSKLIHRDLSPKNIFIKKYD